MLVFKLPIHDRYEADLTMLETSQMQTTIHPIKIQYPTKLMPPNLYIIVKHIVHPH